MKAWPEEKGKAPAPDAKDATLGVEVTRKRGWARPGSSISRRFARVRKYGCSSPTTPFPIR
jgi:hypothetical protein